VIILDSNVISEMMKPAPDARVRKWFGRQLASGLYTTAVTQAEILFGLAVMPKGKRRDALLSAAEAMFDSLFAGRLLAFDSDAARKSAHIGAQRRRMGRPIAQSDLQIAAIASSRGAQLATRNTADFSPLRCPGDQSLDGVSPA